MLPLPLACSFTRFVGNKQTNSAEIGDPPSILPTNDNDSIIFPPNSDCFAAFRTAYCPKASLTANFSLSQSPVALRSYTCLFESLFLFSERFAHAQNETV